MATPRQPASRSVAWPKFAVLALALAAVGLPVNQLATYALLVVVTVVVFTGTVSTRLTSWLTAIAIICVAVAAQWLLSPPRIEEGHNAFLPGPADSALQRGLPAEVYRHLANEFEALYPPAVHCTPGSLGCWKGSRVTRTFAFSADGIFHSSDFSRATRTVDFSDPIWLRLGFINELHYNWSTSAPDLHRADRDRRFWMGLKRWHLALPWYEVIRLPAAFVGGELCWRGEVMWEEGDGRFTALPGDNCRTLAASDAGRRVFGIAIKPDTLAMTLKPPWPVRLVQIANLCLALFAVVGVMRMLVRFEPRRTVVPLLLVGLAVLVIAIDDVSFLGGVRPFDGGDDGLFYDHIGRVMLQKLLAGDVAGFLEGGEKVFYYGGPGLRYFRALEHIPFGETYFGYLSLVLLFPFLVLMLFKRFLPGDWSLVLILIFIAIPIGTLFGTTFVQYSKWAARGFADPAAYIFFTAGILPIIGTAPSGPSRKFVLAFFGALLLALAIFMKPIVAPAVAVLLGAAGLIALNHRQWARVSGLCIGFLPVFSMALHNWAFGGVFVLFSANATDSSLLVMPPSAYAAAAGELTTFNFGGEHVARMGAQILHWLSGPAEVYATIPLNVAGVAILIYVVGSRRFDPWLRILGGAALAQHMVAFFYNAAAARYHFLTWLLTGLAAMVWLHELGASWLQRRYPDFCRRVADHPACARLASGVARLQKVSS
jgi:hypothetical protein